ncbi:hypothetical protein MIMGU_mgv1a019711mg [Erythranthe guttata]|uniref:Uncharacterized protein n=1 Tax=Erythranthe guttata TaxID=4155 RepID=A0A022R4I2_ERYGU|nr:hypothetical protein MIMGU_mgv1a019711mg [Erythranthe guttata]
MLQCVLDGILSMCDLDMERRPYHRNCKCALHKSKAKCSLVNPLQRSISFPKREFRKSYSCSLSSSLSSKIHDSSTRSRDCTNEVKVDSSTNSAVEKVV